MYAYVFAAGHEELKRAMREMGTYVLSGGILLGSKKDPKFKKVGVYLFCLNVPDISNIAQETIIALKQGNRMNLFDLTRNEDEAINGITPMWVE